MKNHIMFAKYNEEANAAVLGLLNKLSNDEREKERGSYYKTLSGLVRHIAGATVYFSGAFKAALPNTAAVKPLDALDAIKIPEGSLTEAGWKELAANVALIDKALVDFCQVLRDADLAVPVKWFSGNPPTIPLDSMLCQLAAHNAHHRGQLSQILDELKVEHNFSGINPAFCVAD